MAEGKKSFLLYVDLIHTIEHLSCEKAGKLFKLILEYVNDKNPDNPKDTVLKIAFEPIKRQLKRDLKEWEEERSKRSIAGKLGGIKSGESRRLRSKRSSASKNEANEADNVTVNDTVTVNVTDSVKEKNTGKTGGRFASPTQPQVFELMKEKGLSEFSANREAAKFINHYESNGWRVGKNKMKSWTHTVANWIGRLDSHGLNGQKKPVIDADDFV